MVYNLLAGCGYGGPALHTQHVPSYSGRQQHLDDDSAATHAHYLAIKLQWLIISTTSNHSFQVSLFNDTVLLLSSGLTIYDFQDLILIYQGP